MSTVNAGQTLSRELEELSEVALDLRFADTQTPARIWQELDPEAWERSRNPWMILRSASQDGLKGIAADKELRRWLRWRRCYMANSGWYEKEYGAAELKRVAYFSKEFALGDALPIHRNGSGLLAGDLLKSASDLNVPVVGVGLLYQQGTLRQAIADDAWQTDAFPCNDPGTLQIKPALDSDRRPLTVGLDLPGRTLRLRVWQVRVGKVDLYLLDSNHPLNAAWDRGITANLYETTPEYRLLQCLVLGIGGWRLLATLGIEAQVCHLNDAHGAFVVLARAVTFAEQHGVPFNVALRATRAGNVVTIGASAEEDFERFETTLLTRIVQPLLQQAGITADELVVMGRKDPDDVCEQFNMAYLAMRACCWAGAISRLHGVVCRRSFQALFPGWPPPEVPVVHVSGGVHLPTWTTEVDERFSGEVCGESQNPERTVKAIKELSDEQLWSFRAAAREKLVDYVRCQLSQRLQDRGRPEDVTERAERVLDPSFLTLGFARRFTEQCRPTLILRDAERLARILCDDERPVQVVIAGKANPNDSAAKMLVQQIVWFSWREDVGDRFVFLEDCDVATARHLAAGVDVWLSTSRRSTEPCDTSSMRALAGGGLALSTLDGWWDEAAEPHLGWSLGDSREHGDEHDADDADQLYGLLERQIVPEFYDRDSDGIAHGWTDRIRASMTSLTQQFSSDRMLREYVRRVYLPAARAHLCRADNGGRLAKDLECWHAAIEQHWDSVRFGEVTHREADGQLHFEVQAYLGDLDLDSVQIQVYADMVEDSDPVCVTMRREDPIHGTANGFIYRASVAADRPVDHFTPRIVPHHVKAFVPLEVTNTLWYR